MADVAMRVSVELTGQARRSMAKGLNQLFIRLDDRPNGLEQAPVRVCDVELLLPYADVFNARL